MVISVETTMLHPTRGFIKLEDTLAVTANGYEMFGDSGRGWNRGGTAQPEPLAYSRLRPNGFQRTVPSRMRSRAMVSRPEPAMIGRPTTDQAVGMFVEEQRADDHRPDDLRIMRRRELVGRRERVAREQAICPPAAKTPAMTSIAACCRSAAVNEVDRHRDSVEDQAVEDQEAEHGRARFLRGQRAHQDDADGGEQARRRAPRDGRARARGSPAGPPAARRRNPATTANQRHGPTCSLSTNSDRMVTKSGARKTSA